MTQTLLIIDTIMIA